LIDANNHECFSFPVKKPHLIIVILASALVGMVVGILVRGPYELREYGQTLVRVNRITGNTWAFGAGGWVELDSLQENQPRSVSTVSEAPPAERLVSPTIGERVDLRSAGYDPDRVMRIVGAPDRNNNSPIIELKGQPLSNGQQLVNRFRIVD
jgi:hypothetical protein